MTAVSVDLGTGTGVGTTASIGVEPHINWQQETGFPDFTATNLEDDTGAATTLDLELLEATGNSTTLATGSGDLFNMYTRGVRVNDAPTTDLIITSIPYSTYKVYVYFCELASGTSPNLVTCTDGTTSYFYEMQGADNFNGGTLGRVSSTSSGSPDTVGNYILFEGLTSTSVTISTFSDNDNDIAITGMQVVEDAGSGVTGTLAVTLEDDTSTASGTVTANITGSASITLADDASAASGTVTQVITGALAVTLQDDTSTAAGQVIVSGTASIVLEDDALAASGSVSQVFGTANVTLVDDALASSGQVIFTGSASITLEDDSLAGVGVVSQSITGTASITLEDDASTASGTVLVNVTGTASVTLADDISIASGLVSIGALAECTLVDRVGTPLPNLVQLSWAWFDNADPSDFVGPTDKGDAETTDGAGLIEVVMPNSSLSSGQTGTLTIRSNDGLLLGSYNLNVL